MNAFARVLLGSAAVCFGGHVHLNMMHQCSHLAMLEIDMLYKNVLANEKLSENEARFLEKWQQDAMAEQRDWLNKPFFEKIIHEPPFPPSSKLICRLGLPMSKYHNPLF